MSNKTTALTGLNGKYATAALSASPKIKADSSVQIPIERTINTKKNSTVTVRITTRPAPVDRKTSE